MFTQIFTYIIEEETNSYKFLIDEILEKDIIAQTPRNFREAQESIRAERRQWCDREDKNIKYYFIRKSSAR